MAPGEKADLRSHRFDLKPGHATMKAVVTTGNGGYDKLDYRDVPIPEPAAGEVLIKVLAAGVNNTEINTRLGWYSSSVTRSTAETATSGEVKRPDGGWNDATPFPFIQGTDCCGIVTSIGSGGDPSLVGQRILVRSCMRLHGFGSMETIWMASDFDGAFAQFVKVPQSEVFPVNCHWSDAELATIPCAYGTAENMLHRTHVGNGDHVLITGASGGVGSAALQLAKRRGAKVTAVTAAEKASALRAIGADYILDRQAGMPDHLHGAIDVVVDNVAGPGFGAALKTLKRGGRYVSSGAIAGPVVALDMRDFYLKDLTLIGCTVWDQPVFPNVVSYIERGEIRPLIAGTFPLDRIAEAQRAFLEKKHVGNFVLIPPPVEA